MDDDKWLEELRAQRELLQKHLEWLDAKIAEQESSGKVATGAPGPVVAANPEASSDRGNNECTTGSKATEAEPRITSEIEKSTQLLRGEDNAEDKFHTYKAPTGDDVRRAKIGCFVLFFLSVALFLFLLFGLPYLLD